MGGGIKLAKLLELLDEDYRIANKISTDTNVHTPLNSIENFKKKYMPFLSNFPEESPLRKDAILEIKIAIQNQHNNGETLLTPSGEINDTKFSEITTASCKELQKKYLNIDFSNLGSVAQQYQQQYTSETQESKQTIEPNNINFNNPEERKAYFNDLFNQYNKLESFEEKRDWFSQNFYNINDLAKKEQQQTLDNLEKGHEVLQLYAEIEEKNPDASEDWDKLKKEALENKANEENLSVSHLEKCTKYTILLQKINLEQNEKLREVLTKEAKRLRIELKISQDKQDEIINSKNNINSSNTNIQKNEEEINISDNEDFQIEEDFTMPGIEEELQTSEEFSIPEIEDETLENSNEFTMPEVSTDLENKEDLNEEQPKIKNKVNSIMANVPEKDFLPNDIKDTQANPIIDFFKNIQNKLTQKRLTDGKITQKSEKKPTLLNRLKNSVLKFFNQKDKILAIDTAENNTKIDAPFENSFDNSIAVSDEVKNKVIIAGQKTSMENRSIKKSNKIETSRETISM